MLIFDKKNKYYKKIYDLQFLNKYKYLMNSDKLDNLIVEHYVVAETILHNFC